MKIGIGKLKTMKTTITILLSLLFVGCGEKKEASKVIKITHASNEGIPIDLPLCVTSTDTIYFNPIINHSEIRRKQYITLQHCFFTYH